MYNANNTGTKKGSIMK